MSYYDLCCQHKGQVVRITEKCGNVHVGKIAHVDQKNVWLDRGQSRHGFGYGYYGHPGAYGAYPAHGAAGYGHGHYAGYGPGHGAGYGHGYGGGFGRNPYIVPVALAGIGGFALGSAFFW